MAQKEKCSRASTKKRLFSASKQSNQSWLNELLIISRTCPRVRGGGNWPYNGSAKCAQPTTLCYVWCATRRIAAVWAKRDLYGPGQRNERRCRNWRPRSGRVLLDKYRVKQHWGKLRRNENKGGTCAVLRVGTASSFLCFLLLSLTLIVPGPEWETHLRYSSFQLYSGLNKRVFAYICVPHPCRIYVFTILSTRDF